MNLEQVYNEFQRLCGISAQELEVWRAVCDACAGQILSRVPADCDPHDPRLAQAAAGQAYYRYALAQAGQSSGNVKIGDISVSQASHSVEAARALRDELLAAAAPLLHGGFAVLRQV